MNHAVHSTWFGVLGETGFPGIITFITMIVVMTLSLIRSLAILQRVDAPMVIQAAGLGLLSGVAGFVASGTFLTQGFTWPVYILIALSAALSRYANCAEQNTKPILQTSKLKNKKLFIFNILKTKQLGKRSA